MAERLLTESEYRLSIALLEFIAVDQITRLRHSYPEPKPLYHEGQKNFEYGFMVMLWAEILRTDSNFEYYPTWKEGDQLSIPKDANRRDLDELLEAFAYHVGYVDELYRTELPIQPNNPYLQNLCEALQAEGYRKYQGIKEASSDEPKGLFQKMGGSLFSLIMTVGNSRAPSSSWDEGYLWTDKIAPWFIKSGDWDLLEVEPAETSLVQSAIAQIPKEKIVLLSGRSFKYAPEFVRYFFGQWRNQKWNEQHDSSEWTPRETWDLPLVAGVYRELHIV